MKLAGIARLGMTALSAALILATGMTPGPARAGSKKLNVVTTTSDLRSITEAIGGDKVKVANIATGYQDPHFVEAKPSYMMKAKKADLWIRVGLELEIGYEQLIIDGSRNRRIRVGTPGHLDVSVGVERLEVPTTQKVDRSMGDIHPLGNPHYWVDPLNGKVIARNIARRLSELSPENAEYFERNLEAFDRRVDEALFGKALVEQLGGEKLSALLKAGDLDAFLEQQGLSDRLGGWLGIMRPHRGEKIVTYHRSWPNFAHRFGLVIADELEPKPGIPPSPGHVAEVIRRMKEENIRVILMEPFYDRKPAELVAKRTGAKVVMVANSVGGTPEAKDYVSLIGAVVRKVAAALSAGQ